MAFGKEILRLRKAVNISAEKLAKMIGIRADRLRKWEEKDNDPREEDTRRIEEFFGMEIQKVMELDSIRKFLKVQKSNEEVVNEDGLGKKAKTEVNSGKSADNTLDEEKIDVVLEALRSEIRLKYNRFAEEIIESADKILRSHTDKPAVVGRKHK